MAGSVGYLTQSRHLCSVRKHFSATFYSRLILNFGQVTLIKTTPNVGVTSTSPSSLFPPFHMAARYGVDPVLSTVQELDPPFCPHGMAR